MPALLLLLLANDYSIFCKTTQPRPCGRREYPSIELFNGLSYPSKYDRRCPHRIKKSGPSLLRWITAEERLYHRTHANLGDARMWGLGSHEQGSCSDIFGLQHA